MVYLCGETIGVRYDELKLQTLPVAHTKQVQIYWERGGKEDAALKAVPYEITWLCMGVDKLLEMPNRLDSRYKLGHIKC